MARIAFLSCHLSGTGHLVRTLMLARAARALGHEVMLLSGGRPLAHLERGGVAFVQLPPVTIRGLEFGVLRTASGAKAGEGYMAARREALTAALEPFEADALVTELYPFGRRVLGEEFRFAIAEARRVRPGASVVCSVRDIPEPKPKRLDEVAARLRADFDGVLVHGDAGFVPLSASWPLPEDLAGMIHHTGYVGRAMPEAARGETVVVSVGGGVLGRRLSRVAVAAAALDARPWHVLIGGADAADLAEELGAGARPGVTVEPARRDFPGLLAAAACSVSLCGYNTAVELAQCRVPAILVPSDEGGEREQGLRAARFAGLPGFRVMALAAVTPAALAAAVGEMAALGDRPEVALRIDDGSAAVRRIETILEGKA